MHVSFTQLVGSLHCNQFFLPKKFFQQRRDWQVPEAEVGGGGGKTKGVKGGARNWGGGVAAARGGKKGGGRGGGRGEMGATLSRV